MQSIVLPFFFKCKRIERKVISLRAASSLVVYSLRDLKDASHIALLGIKLSKNRKFRSRVQKRDATAVILSPAQYTLRRKKKQVQVKQMKQSLYRMSPS